MLKSPDFAEPGRLPSEEQLLMIRAALFPGPEGRRAGSTWLENAKIERLGKASRRLLPLLYNRFQREGVRHPLLPILKGVKRHTWYRNQMLFRSTSEAIGILAEGGIETMLIKGAAIATEYYHDASLRPMEDADLMVHYGDAPSALELLRNKGWRALVKPAESPAFFSKMRKYRHAVHLIHPSGAYLDLHWNMLHFCFGPQENEDFWRGSNPAVFNGQKVRVLDPADQLLHICVHGAAWDCLSPIRWIADAVIVIRSRPDLDWERMLRQAELRKLTLMVREALNYIDKHFGGLVPPAILSEFANTKVTLFERLEYWQVTRPGETINWAGRIALKFWRISKSKTMREQTFSFQDLLCAQWDATSKWQLPLIFLDKSWRKLRNSLPIF